VGDAPGVSAARRTVGDRTLTGLVDLFRGEQNHRPGGRSTGSAHGDRDRGSGLIVRQVRDHVGVVFAEREVERLQGASDALGYLFDGGPPCASAILLESPDTIDRVRRAEQVLGHRSTSTSVVVHLLTEGGSVSTKVH